METTQDPHKDPNQDNLLDYATDKYLWRNFTISHHPTGECCFNYYSTETGTNRRLYISKEEAHLITGIWNLYHSSILNSPFRTDYADQKYIDRAKRRVAELKNAKMVAA